MTLSPSEPTAPASAPGTDLFARYALPPGARDEAAASGGTWHSHFETVLREMRAFGADEVQQRFQSARRLLHDHGAAFSTITDGAARPSDLDPLPLVIAESDWARLERGLRQRALLLDLILQDVYGPQRLLQQNLLPPELVFANPDFWRPVHGVALKRMLHIYAADLARGPAGEWVVLRDRTQAPSGLGYALENRLVVSRVFPEMIRDCGAERLAPFFDHLRLLLDNLAPPHRDTPRIVVLTPGMAEETYFEHSFVARYLGLTLVEGEDLTARSDQICLKTLEGLQPVDVILRRVADGMCDPLDLKGGSAQGVPGLVPAVRAGNVALANALGTGLAESPALFPFLPALCSYLLGEDLCLASQRAWWCGDPSARAEAASRFDDLVWAPAFPGGGAYPFLGGSLSAADKEGFLASVEDEPWRHVALEPVPLSTVPAWRGDRLEPRGLVLRTYAASDNGTFAVMPGGHARLQPVGSNQPFVANERSGGSKDVWVMGGQPEPHAVTLHITDTPLDIRRSGTDLPSRVADNLFWVGRYVERLEGATRILRSLLARLTDERTPQEGLEYPSLLRALTYYRGPGMSPVAYAPQPDLESVEAEILTVLYEEGRPGNVRATVGAVQHIAQRLRDRLSSDTSRLLNRLGDQFATLQSSPARTLAGTLELLDHMVLELAAFSGLAQESMTRSPGWRFLDIGRRIERTIHTLNLLRNTLTRAGDHDTALMGVVLDILDSAMTYRSRYLGSLQAQPVLDLVLLDDTNPRSIAFQLAALRDHVRNLPGAGRGELPSAEDRLVLRMESRIQTAELPILVQAGSNGFRGFLDELLSALQADIPLLSEMLARSYLSHAESSRPLAVRRANGRSRA